MVRSSVTAVLPILVTAMAWAQPAPLSNRPVFFKRELVSPDSDQRRVLDKVLTKTVDGTLDALLEGTYNEVDPEKSLLIHDCGLGSPWWCLDPQFSFDSIFRRASDAGGVAPDQTFRRWMIEADASGGVPDFVPTLRNLWDGTNLAGAPFQLLAVANRLDLGEWDPRSREWRGAEVRFVYGLRGEVGGQVFNMNLILEFVLSGMQWRDYRNAAGAWHQLRLESPATFTAALKKAVNLSLAPGARFVRLRTNSNLTGGLWTLAQWEFRSGGRFAQTELDDQIRPECVQDLQTPGCGGYLLFWQSFYGSVESPRFWPAPVSLLARIAKNDRPPWQDTAFPEGMPMPPKSCLPDTVARRVIALQQCTSCHATETDVKFVQIANRKPNDPTAILSAFLTGDVIGRPSFDSLRPNAGHVAKVGFQADVRKEGQCRSLGTVEERSFNDLARRALFLGAVLIVPPEQIPNVAQQELMLRYQTDLTH